MLAFPITTFDFFLIPEIMNAMSGGAFTYPIHNKMSKSITTTITVIKVPIPFIVNSSFVFECLPA